MPAGIQAVAGLQPVTITQVGLCPTKGGCNPPCTIVTGHSPATALVISPTLVQASACTYENIQRPLKL